MKHIISIIMVLRQTKNWHLKTSINLKDLFCQYFLVFIVDKYLN